MHASTAAMPNRWPMTRSIGDGTPPRCGWPSATARESHVVLLADLLGQPRADAAEALRGQSVDLLLDGDLLAARTAARLRRRPPRRSAGAGDRVLPLASRSSSSLSTRSTIERRFGDERDERAARQARPQRQMARVATHHLDDLHPMMRAGRRARALDDVGAGAHRRVEAERVVGAAEILVDRLRDADDRRAIWPRAWRRRRACPRRRSARARRARACACWR